MTDNELRGLILKKYYGKRREGYFQWSDDDFKDLPDSVDFDAVDLFRICDQLAEHGLIEWKAESVLASVLGNVEFRRPLPKSRTRKRDRELSARARFHRLLNRVLPVARLET
jgi:hypothetical protein